MGRDATTDATTDSGDDGFDAFVAARQSALLRSAWLLTGDWPQAEDLLQTALVRTLPHWSRLREQGNPEAYVRRAVINAYLSWWRRARRREWPVAEPASERATAERGYADVEDRDQLRKLLAALPRRQRAVVVLRYYDDLSEAQTAAVLGCSTGTVKSQAAKGLAKLRAGLPGASATIHQGDHE